MVSEGVQTEHMFLDQNRMWQMEQYRKFGISASLFQHHHHHHQSGTISVLRLATTSLHLFPSFAYRIQSSWFILDYLKMSFLHVFLCASLRLTPSTFPSRSILCNTTALIKCPKNVSFLCLTVLDNHRFSLTFLSTSSLVTQSVCDIFNILR